MWMDVLRAWPSHKRRLAAVAATLVVVGCNEDLTGSAACPQLCPGTTVQVLDTVLNAVAFDTVVGGLLTLGAEPSLLLASRGDTLDTRVVVRFDTLPGTFSKGGVDSAITAVDSAFLLLRLAESGTRVTAPVRIDLYNVDTVATDTSQAAILAMFREDRLIGGSTLDTNQVKDSMKVFLSNDKLVDIIKNRARLRVGLRLTSASSAQINIGASNGSLSAELKYDPHPADTAIKAYTVTQLSRSPTDNSTLQTDLQDYLVIAKTPPQPSSDILSIGGLPSRRVYLRFDVPRRILDSATVLRATLVLTQRANPLLDRRDSVLILPQVVTAGEELADIGRSSVLLSSFPVDTIRVAPGDSGIRIVEVAAALRQWTTENNVFRQQRAIVIRSNAEGVSPFDAHFYSLRAAEPLRPRLRVSYSLRTSFGIP
jgi:hypothetical protein